MCRCCWLRQWRVREWKVLQGLDPEVHFPLSFVPGEFAFCDFIALKGMAVSIAFHMFPDLLFHFHLAWSSLRYTQVVQGGESTLLHLRGCRTPWVPVVGCRMN